MSVSNIVRLTFFFCLLSWHWALGGSIHEAASSGDIQFIQQSVAQSKDSIDARDDDGRTALYLAASAGQADIATLLLESGADVEAKDNRGSTPLLAAIRANDLTMVRILAEAGADLNAEHPSYGPAIYLAYWQECMKGQSGITAYLISRGVLFDANIETWIATPLNLATTFGSYDMAKFALDRGADVNKVSTQDGMTEFHFAVSCGHANIVRLFLEHGANPDVATNDGVPPIFHAIDRGHADIVRELLAHDAPIDYIESEHQRTLLHVAALRGSADIVSLLLSLGADANADDGLGRTPLYYAERYGHQTVANRLLEQGGRRLPLMDDVTDPSAVLSEELPAGHATVWALQGRGWAIRTVNHLLIIDCLQSTLTSPTDPSLANGFITASEIADQNVLVVYSTFHWPDQLEYVHTIEDSLAQINYVHNKNEAWRGCKNTVYVEAGETRRIGDATIHVLQIAHANPALGYIIEIDSLTLYCGIFAADDSVQFSDDLQSLRSQVGTIDIALVPVPETEDDESQFFRPLVETLNPSAVFLSDPAGRTQSHTRTEAKIRQWGSGAAVFGPENPGDRFAYRRGD